MGTERRRNSTNPKGGGESLRNNININVPVYFNFNSKREYCRYPFEGAQLH